MPYATFDSTKEELSKLLRDAECGKLQLPDFQRGWVWDDYGIRSLLASISQSFPIGAVMMLQSGGEVRFRPRPLEGITDNMITHNPERLILDGQQRLTSLFQSCLLAKPVVTMNEQRRTIKRWYYIDMALALDPNVDREEAIIGVPEDRQITRDFGRDVVLDVSTPEREYERSLFPCTHLFKSTEWWMAYQKYWKYDGEKIEFFQKFYQEVVKAFEHYNVPVISLGKETSKEAVCLVFEKVNTGGKKLDAFELLTAIYAASDFNLRDDWLGRREGADGRLMRLAKHNVLKDTASTDFLQAIALLHTQDVRDAILRGGATNPKDIPPVSCQRKAILNLPLEAYQRYADEVEEGFKRAARFLTLQKVFWFKDVPYQSQIVPLAAVLVRLGDLWEQQGVRSLLGRWYWCGVFGELYGSAIETRFAKDFVEVPNWINGGPEPTTVRDASFSPDRLYSLRSRLSAAYKGISALLKVTGGCDLRSGQPIEYSSFWEESVDIHHIFPRAWCERRSIDRNRYDSIVNKTPLSARTNRIISAKGPSEYLAQLEREAGVSADRMDDLLVTHAIPAERLRVDDFDGFMRDRTEALLVLIERAMGKPVLRDTPTLEGTDAGESLEEVLESLETDAPILQ